MPLNQEFTFTPPEETIRLFMPNPVDPSAKGLVPVTFMEREVPPAPVVPSFCGGVVTVAPVPQGYAIQATALAFMMFPSSMSSCITQDRGGIVGVRVKVGVGV
jgi:hypothetical protein